MSLAVQEVVYCVDLAVIIDAQIDASFSRRGHARLENHQFSSQLPSFTDLYVEFNSIIYT